MAGPHEPVSIQSSLLRRRSFLSCCKSASTISLTNSSNVVLWVQPNRSFAFVGSPSNVSTSVGRQ